MGVFPRIDVNDLLSLHEIAEIMLLVPVQDPVGAVVIAVNAESVSLRDDAREDIEGLRLVPDDEKAGLHAVFRQNIHRSANALLIHILGSIYGHCHDLCII